MTIEFDTVDELDDGRGARKPTPYDDALLSSLETGKAKMFRYTLTPDERADVAEWEKARNNMGAVIRNAARSLIPDKTAKVRFSEVTKGVVEVRFKVADRNKRKASTSSDD